MPFLQDNSVTVQLDTRHKCTYHKNQAARSFFRDKTIDTEIRKVRDCSKGIQFNICLQTYLLHLSFVNKPLFESWKYNI